MKKISIVILSVFLVLFGIVKSLEWLIESKFEANLNANPNRAYDIKYTDFDLDTFFKGVTLDEIKITPLNHANGNIITAEVDYARINGLVWLKLLTGQELQINEITFERPIFEIVLSNDTINKTSGKGMQDLFGDILSRISLNSFCIKEGSVDFIDPNDQSIKGQIKHVNILATEIVTDSLTSTYLIPFEMGNLSADIDSISFKVNDYTNITLNNLHYDLMEKEISLVDLSLNYSIDWLEVSKKIAVRKPIIEFHAKDINILELEPSSQFYSKLDLIAQNLIINELDIKIHSNKNYDRPPDDVKPMFQGIVKSIPISISIDSIELLNSKLTYKELGIAKNETSQIEITKINGLITDITNIPELQLTKTEIEANIDALILDESDLNLALNIPYKKEIFSLEVDVGKLNLAALNPTLSPMAGIEFVSGQMERLRYEMKAGALNSQNKLHFDYSDLRIHILNQKNKGKTRRLLSGIGNLAIKTNNLSTLKNYRVVEYLSERNIYRYPVNYILLGLIQGFTSIVPQKPMQKIMKRQPLQLTTLHNRN
ncbi:MAG: DUF748 domain-containing protein [Crocinitomicaceae bacterium]|nr:DUF748 domain-containing protein [Crocinitomicaceae bacterium]